MYYEINVAFEGKHYFATAARSLTDQVKAERMFEHFTRVFPQGLGYKVTMYRYETIGREIK